MQACLVVVALQPQWGKQTGLELVREDTGGIIHKSVFGKYKQVWAEGRHGTRGNAGERLKSGLFPPLMKVEKVCFMAIILIFDK